MQYMHLSARHSEVRGRTRSRNDPCFHFSLPACTRSASRVCWQRFFSVFGLLMAMPGVLHAQTSGDNGPVVGRVAPGQTAAVVEGTTESALNYMANVIFPLLTVAFLGLMVFCIRTGRGWVVSLCCAIGCLVLSGATRLLEYHVQQGAQGIR
ncbi:MAG: hypothetical protein ACJ746_18735 [Bryobacteraceae bacterium]